MFKMILTGSCIVWHSREINHRQSKRLGGMRGYTGLVQVENENQRQLV